MSSLSTKRFAYSFIVFFIVANVLWNIIFSSNQQLLDWGGVSFQLIACSASIYWILSTFLKDKTSAKSFWLLLALGVLFYLVGTMLWSYNQFILNNNSGYGKLAEKFFIVQNILYFLSLLVLINQIKSSLLTIRFLLDILIAMSAAVTFSWLFLIRPLFSQSANISFSLTELIYPILDLIVLVGVISLFNTSKRVLAKKTTFLLVAGLLTQIVADTIFTYLKVIDAYSVGSINEPMWILSALLIGLSGIYHQPAPAFALSRNNTQENENIYIKHIIPYFGVLILTFYFTYLLYGTHPVFLGLSISIILLIIRQIFTLLENDRLVDDLNKLNEGLEQKVKERTDKLVEIINSMEYLAFHDVVTGLPNRRYMEKRLAQALENNCSSKKLAFILLDLDRFKHINDSLGHSYGDLLLKEVGERLSANVSPNGVVCRIGGDEYALLIENAEICKIEELAQLILKSLRESYFINNVELNITPSIGIAMYPDHGSDLDALLMKADTAMYNVKENGKDHFKVYNGSMSMKSIMELERSIRKGLERNEFILHYQPQISLHTRQIVGVEALVRWERPGIGLVPPGEFIPIAEETGLILPIGESVLWQACRQSVLWCKKGFPDLRIAVNISSLQFQQENFVNLVKTIMNETGANPKNIELEITESIAMGPIEQNMSKLACLKEMGFNIAIDDFGTGYSSLHYLSKFQIDRLKIDRSFITSLEKSEKDTAIVRMIVMMSKALNVKVIAEGVEDEHQRAFLEEVQCDELQGYLFSRPLNVEDCEKFLVNNAL
ncbi:putative bifunctional diguanylate cyclase/phosphodiesterase [Bacillus sp. Au-Bac7]|uniref:putative bifunctional diguanylate cyclase/phosphodiesterase n=1 Tax=Bacillus sp. Au-Bac7 TaxID=2906458 RepID=UPI001E4E3D8F|nr:EAL domain-containing protein [Bacillus sp. Au-Bac7]MCE4047597.1 EAL domain-containing protein [Bacillus sp. Au-Bac7]